jgi:hypothetical protein
MHLTSYCHQLYTYFSKFNPKKGFSSASRFHFKEKQEKSTTKAQAKEIYTHTKASHLISHDLNEYLSEEKKKKKGAQKSLLELSYLTCLLDLIRY